MAARGARGPQPLTAISRSGDWRFAQAAQIIACRTDVGSEWRRSMKTVPLPALLAILAALSANPAAAQQRAGVPQQVPPLANPSPSFLGVVSHPSATADTERRGHLGRPEQEAARARAATTRRKLNDPAPLDPNPLGISASSGSA
jgi:hypothetical protein